MDSNLNRDLRSLERYAWENEDQVAEVAKQVRTFILAQEERLERLDKVEEILTKLEAEGKTDVLKYFESLKTS